MNALARLAGFSGLLLVAAANAQNPTTPFQITTRWHLDTPIGAGGATLVSLTLQARVTYLAPLPENTSTRRWGNFGIWGLGYGPAGAQQPATITFDGPVSLRRGDWGVYSGIDENGEAVSTEFMRGAAPGVFTADPFSLRFGMRNFGPPAQTTSAINDATGNGPGQLDRSNGFFLPDGSMTQLDMIRADYANSTGPHPLWSNPAAGLNVDPIDGGAAWQDIYRIGLVSDLPMVVGEGGVTVSFHGWLRPMIGTGLVGGNLWSAIPGGTSMSTGTQYELAVAMMQFGLVPSPAGAALLGLAGLVVAHRRRA